MTNEFKAGDRVTAIEGGWGDTPVGRSGTIDTVDTDNTAHVFFDLPEGTATGLDKSMKRGWWVPLAALIPEAPKNAPVKVPAAPKAGTRIAQVLRHLTSGKSLTQGEAIILGYGTRLAAHIHDLRGKGHTIVTTMKEDLHGFPYAEYRLVTRRANGNRKAA